MYIRRAKQEDIDGINKLLYQVLMVHHNGRPDIFKANAKKYTNEEIVEIIEVIVNILILMILLVLLSLLKNIMLILIL